MVMMFLAVLGIGGFLLYKEGVFGTAAIGGSGKADVSNCGDTKTSGLKFQVYNRLNDTGAENYDMAGELYKLIDNKWVHEASIVDTTSPTATTVDCGFNYRFCGIRANADGGNNSLFTSVKSGNAEIDDDGCVLIPVETPTVNINLNSEQHDVLTFRIYDNVDARYAYDTGDADSTVFEADGTTFSDGDNTTAFAIGTGGYFDACIEFKGASIDEDFADGYVLVAVEAPLSEYAEPTVKVDGVKKSDISDTGLTAYEEKQLSGYEYVYKFDMDILDDVHELCVYITAASGQDPSTDLQFDFLTSGNYLSVDGITVKHGAAADDASNTVVFTVQDVTVDMS